MGWECYGYGTGVGESEKGDGGADEAYAGDTDRYSYLISYAMTGCTGVHTRVRILARIPAFHSFHC
jgi:hypothetical protein